MAYPTLIFRPASGVGNNNSNTWSVFGGAASAMAALGDNSDTTYISPNGQVPPGTANLQGLDFGNAIAQGFPPGADIRSVKLFIRVSTTAALMSTVLDYATTFGPIIGTDFVAHQNWNVGGPQPAANSFQVGQLMGYYHDGDREQLFAGDTRPVTADVAISGLTLSIAAALQSPATDKIYDAWFLVEYNPKPTLSGVAMSPGDANNRTTKPKFAWTYADAEGDPMTAYRVVIYKKSDVLGDANWVALYSTARTLTGSFVNTLGQTKTAAAGSGLANTGGDPTVFAVANNYQLTKDLTNGVTYTAYIQAASVDTGHVNWSSASSFDFTMDLIVPPPPDAYALVATPDASKGRVALTALGETNLLAVLQESVELGGGVATWFQGVTNATLAQDTTTWLVGATSLRITATAAGALEWNTSPTWSKCKEGDIVCPVIYVQSASTTRRRINLGMRWRNSVTNSNTNSAQTTFWTNGTLWTKIVAGPFVVPAGVDNCAIRVNMPDALGAGEIHRADRMGIQVMGESSYVNYMPNPSFEYGTTTFMWITEGGGTGTPAHAIVADSTAETGSRVQRLIVTGLAEGGTHFNGIASFYCAIPTAATAMVTKIRVRHTLGAAPFPAQQKLWLKWRWKDNTGADLTESSELDVAIPAGDWSTIERVKTPPAGSVNVSMVIYAQRGTGFGTGNVSIDIDSVQWGYKAALPADPFVISDTTRAELAGFNQTAAANMQAIIERSSDSGASWYPLPAQNTGPLNLNAPDGTKVATYDTAPPTNKALLYRLRYSALDPADTTQSMVGPNGPSLAVAAMDIGKWWLSDPGVPDLRVPIQILGDLPESMEEKQGVFQALGSDRFVVVSDAASAPTKIAASVIFKNDADFQLFETMRENRKTLALQGDFPDAFYWVRIGATVSGRLVNNVSRKTATSRARYRDFELLEVAPATGQPRLP